ncbi:MAG: hypothetical protein AAGD07_03720 [Planctomycetota bacterium]
MDSDGQRIDEVDLLIANARLRDELEPYRDEAVDTTAAGRMTLAEENEYLASILAWERAPALPIAQWFDPPLRIPAPDQLDEEQLSLILQQTVERLYSQRIVLSCTDHLSNRQLYGVIYRDILPCCEKKLPSRGNVLEWRCVNDDETWLTFYADAVERRRFQEEHCVEPPPRQRPRYRRRLPR